MSKFLLLLFIYSGERAVKWEPLPSLRATSRKKNRQNYLFNLSLTI